MMPKVLFVGPLSDFSGYATVSRNYAKALAMKGFDVATRDLIYDGGQREKDEEEKLFSLKPLDGTNIIFQHTTPNEMEPKAGYFNIGAFCWETDRVPEYWVKQLNKMDLVLVPCESNLMAAKRAGVHVPVEKVHYCFDTSRYKEAVEPFPMPMFKDAFKLLALCQYSEKKGVDALLRAYYSEFTRQDNVLLVLKTYFGPRDGNEERSKMMKIISSIRSGLRLKELPPVRLIHEVMSFEDVDRLYATSDCYCLPSRGEGWGVPHFDGLGFGLPAIATNGTAPEEFIRDGENGFLVNSHPSPCVNMPHPHEFMYTAKDNWMEPHIDSLRACMRRSYDMWRVRDKCPDWSRMRDNAKATVENFSMDSSVPAKLSDTIMKYYTQWREYNEAS